MPRGISSLRKSPITSPASVFTSSPGMTVSARPRASSTASWAPEKTLWSVTAIAPSPIRSAWSRRSGTGTAQSCECSVCMCRSARTSGRSASGSAAAAAGARAACEGRRRRRAPARRRGGRSSRARRARRASAEHRLARQPSSLGRRPSAAPTSSGWPCEPGGSRSGTPEACGLERQARAGPQGRHETGGARQLGRARSRVERRADDDAAAQRARDVRPAGECCRPEDDQLPAREVGQRAERSAEARQLLRPPLEDEAATRPCRGEAPRDRRRAAARGSRREIALRPPRPSPCWSRSARPRGRGASRAVSSRAGSRAARASGRWRRRARVCRGARGRRGSGRPARARGRRRSGRA